MLLAYITLAIKYIATVYGHGEMSCGDINKPQACSYGALTASGEVFDPQIVSAAAPIPSNLIMKSIPIYLLSYKGDCIKVIVNDKKHSRYIGNGGLDLSPAAVKVLTGSTSKTWSGKLTTCIPKKD